MTYHVITTHLADEEIVSTILWFKRHLTESIADRWATETEEAIDSLTRNPQRCPTAHEAEEFGQELRELVYRKKPQVYRILFTMSVDTVIIHSIRHGSLDRFQRRRNQQ